MVYFDAGVTAERMEAWENRWRGFVRGVGEGDGGGLDVCGGWVGEGMEGEGGDGEMRVWMGMGGEGEEAVGGLLRGAEGVVKREIYHVELS